MKYKAILIGLGIGLAGAGLAFFLHFYDPYTPPAKVFDGTSDKLTQTTIVPTLDTPISKGKNVLWCSSIQLAWNRLKEDVIQEPVRIKNAEAVCDRLNRATASEADLAPESFYAAAGRVQDGVIERISKDMSQKFPGVALPQFQSQDEIVAYGYLQVALKFTIPFYEYDHPMEFEAADKTRSFVSGFGIRPKDHNVDVSRQVKVLFATNHECAVDLCKDSSPYQIVVAKIEPGASLADTLKRFDELVVQGPEGSLSGPLFIPNIVWSITHAFSELKGNAFLTKNAEGLFVREALQKIDFRLDRSGATIESSAILVAAKSAAPRSSFIFNQPFLIVMKKRGAKNPFFIMWVDNAELLCKP